MDGTQIRMNDWVECNKQWFHITVGREKGYILYFVNGILEYTEEQQWDS